MRLRNAREKDVRRSLIVAAVLTVLPACSATAGAHRERTNCPTGSGNIVYRPAYPVLRSKPLYLSNYAGVVYPPIRRRAPLETTAVRRPFFSWFAGHGHQP